MGKNQPKNNRVEDADHIPTSTRPRRGILALVYLPNQTAHPTRSTTRKHTQEAVGSIESTLESFNLPRVTLKVQSASAGAKKSNIEDNHQVGPPKNEDIHPKSAFPGVSANKQTCIKPLTAEHDWNKVERSISGDILNSDAESAVLPALNLEDSEEVEELSSGSYSNNEVGSDAPDDHYATGSESDLDAIRERFAKCRLVETNVNGVVVMHASPMPKATVGKRKGKKEGNPVAKQADEDKSEQRASAWSFDEFGDVCQNVADVLCCGVQGLTLSYKIEVDKQQKKWHKLDDKMDWEDIVTFGTKYRLEQAQKKRDVDVWCVSIKDASISSAAKGKAKAAGSAKATVVPERATTPAGPPLHQVPNDSLKCDKHGGARCWIPGLSEASLLQKYSLQQPVHIHITDSEVRKWVSEMNAGNASRNGPGSMLGQEIIKRFASTTQEKIFLKKQESMLSHPHIPGTPSKFDFKLPTAPTPFPDRTFTNIKDNSTMESSSHLKKLKLYFTSLTPWLKA
ncbi:SubName: Full=Uncharacterized protein {ECO:0000313/EMBL:CCA76304.1} [Serendipita indica DSM 11827]|uniref:Uncharacterized protein n=1 Tax=Serendipita indica (strain DSM 11827) TaxID=1109443 RepID=G4TYB1_SERID|nr:SubName: Full=Uncharacterized protein {ECO:0000313/EMBL:CCA76304.1} [Serendipita indica DSM 11827]CCA76304.1 hypothetical protein PIIN_10299 [Serendipita indica DSM 11827]